MPYTRKINHLIAEGKMSVKELLNAVVSPVAITDRSGHVLWANDACQTIHSSIHLSIVLAPYLAKYHQTMAKSHQLKIGEMWWSMKIEFIQTEDWEHEVYVCSMINDLKRNSIQRIRGLKNIYRSFINTSFEMMFRSTLSGNIQLSNLRFAKTFGFKSAHAVNGVSIKTLFVDQDDYQRLESEIQSQLLVLDRSFLLKSNGSSPIKVIANISKHFIENGEQVINWTMLDITKQEKHEQELTEKNLELAKINAQMEKFLYSTSHDLRSPITSVLGLINLLRMELKNSEVNDYIDKIETSTLKLDKIIRDIITFSKSAYQRTSSERIDFESLVWKAINTYKTDPALRRIMFEVQSSGAFPFYSDIERIEVILDNLIRNCIHFYDPNKAKPFIRVIIQITKDETVLHIFDNGIGIGEQHLDRVFNMFYKASTQSKGAGLGLFIVKETITKLNGRIALESEIGFGTSVKIVIPNDHKGKLIGRKLSLQQNLEIN